ncbi:4686_t:CDS:2 [Funneliformis geosporum]|uniref:18602_t:CDS:1 n=1 Tax=Funneliformis geosporum TaxID=1117311 RepID=A0A9W4WXU6_9GLOM|nr:4686_t:CDS:2 [Funneliformis geosporum]CAI2187217.1 18602_t:CDS:2 [Funneliformis geosporum]
MSSTVAKGKELEQRIFNILRSVEIECKWTGGSGDGGVDIIGVVVGIPFVIQCKNWTKHKIGPSVIRELEGALTRQTRGTIGVVVGHSKYRFTPGAIDTARTSIYDIILTDKKDLSVDPDFLDAIILAEFDCHIKGD